MLHMYPGDHVFPRSSFARQPRAPTFRSRARGTEGAEVRIQLRTSTSQLSAVGSERETKTNQSITTPVAGENGTRRFEIALKYRRFLRLTYGYWLWIRE